MPDKVPQAPNSPVLAADPTIPLKLNLAWTPVTKAPDGTNVTVTHYEVRYRTWPDSPPPTTKPSPIFMRFGLSGTIFDYHPNPFPITNDLPPFNFLKGKHWYQFSIRAVTNGLAPGQGGAGAVTSGTPGPWSLFSNAVLVEALPSAVSNFRLISQDGFNITLSWSPPANVLNSSIIDYEMQWKNAFDSDISYQNLSKSVSNALTQTVTVPVGPLNIRIAAKTNKGMGPYLDYATSSRRLYGGSGYWIPTPPPLVKNLIITPFPVSNTVLFSWGTIGWNDNGGYRNGVIQKMKIQFRLNGTSEWTTVELDGIDGLCGIKGTYAVPPKAVTEPLYYYTLTGLTNATYDFRIAAVNRYGTGLWSAVQTYNLT